MVAQYFGAAWFLRLMVKRNMAARLRGLAESLPSLLDLGRNGVLLTTRTGLLLATLTIAASVATRLGPRSPPIGWWPRFSSCRPCWPTRSQSQPRPWSATPAAHGDIAELHSLNRRLVGWGVVAGLILMVGIGLGRFGLEYLASEEVVAAIAVGAAGVVALAEPIAAVMFVGDGIFLGLFALGTMVISTGAGGVAAVALMLFTPLGDSVTGIWWAMAVMLVVRGVVLLAGYPRSVRTAVRS